MAATNVSPTSGKVWYGPKAPRTPSSLTFPSRGASGTRKRALNEPVGSSKSRRTELDTPSRGPIEVVDLTRDSVSPKKRKRKTISSESGQTPEKRARRFRPHPPLSYLERLGRATTQRMFVVGRTRAGTDEVPEEQVDMVGTTGNIYTVTIAREPTCSCPDACKGNQCKHVVYVLVNVLKAPSHLRYQLAFLSSELREMFDKAPLSPQGSKTEEDTPGKRKPIEGDCPICFMEFDSQTEEIVWCKTACGNNIHKTCFDRWAATTNDKGVRCVYCRSAWSREDITSDMQSLMQNGRLGADGYINVAPSVGLSGERDYSTYDQFWVRRQLGRRYYY